MRSDNEEETMSNQPVQEIRLGLIRASIWENSTEHGVRYSTIFTKLYKAADRWQDTAHFSRDDLLLVSKVAELAHAWILQQTQKLMAPGLRDDLPPSGEEILRRPA
jgi:hypothetical protein